MTKIIVDSIELDVPAHYTLMQAAEEAGAEIPRFCFHERLSVAGNCRMCLVEVVGSPKPVASCAMAVKDLRPGPNGEPPVVNTKTPLVKKAREGVMEFLLINHPLDCPICDQGGECDLQDQAMAYGVDKSRYNENKRAVEDKYIGPLVKTVMTRCIHCTRCVRFTTEVVGVTELGATGRGEDMEITTYLEAAMTSEMQGNVVDLCPVGALTSRPHAFQARPWEYDKTESVDVMDAVGSAIRVDSRGREVMRILPRENAWVNEEWISDKTRYVWDGLKTQRLDRPYVRKGGKLVAASWPEGFAAVASQFKKVGAARTGVIAGDLCSVEELFAMKILAQALGIQNLDGRADGTKLHPRFGRASYLFNPTIAGIEEATSILLIGTNPRLEAPVLNVRIRKAWRATRLPIFSIGESADLTYPVQHLGSGTTDLQALLKKSPLVGDKPMILLGQGALSGADGLAVLSLAAQLALKTGNPSSLAVLHTAASRVGALDVGFVPHEGGLDTASMLAAAENGDLDMLFIFGADEIDTARLGKTFVVYMGSHGDAGAHRADVILPGAAYTEKSGLYVNTEGRVQLGSRATFPPGDAKEDWAIVRALSDVLGATLPFDTLQQLRVALFAAHPHMAQIGTIAPITTDEQTQSLQALAAIKTDKPSSEPLVSAVSDFYLTNPIARASRTLAECSALANGSTKIAAE